MVCTNCVALLLEPQEELVDTFIVWQIVTRYATVTQLLHKCKKCGKETLERKEVKNENVQVLNR